MKLFIEEEKKDETLSDKFGGFGAWLDNFWASIQEFLKTVKAAFDKLFNAGKKDDVE